MNLFVRAIQKVSAVLKHRIDEIVVRGVVRLVTDSTSNQLLQAELLKGEFREMENLQQYGFTSNPLPGAEVLVVSRSGDRNAAVIIATGDRRYRKKNLGSGDVALHDATGQHIHIKDSDSIEIWSELTINIGGVLPLFLLNETALATFNNHKHSASGSIPTTQMVLNTDTTLNTKAS